MSLDLDPRQRAMLQEMGVRVWLPESVLDEPVVLEAAQHIVQAPRPVIEVAPKVVPVMSATAIEDIAVSALSTVATGQKDQKTRETDKGVGRPATSTASPASTTLADGTNAMDWPTLAHTVAACQACQLCTGRRAPVFGGADVADETAYQSDWLVVGEPPDESEERAGTPFVDQVGQLLDNMLKAVGVSRRGPDGAASVLSAAQAAYVTNVVKCRPAVVRNPSAPELAICENYLRREVALVRPKVILAMGRFAAQTLLHGSLPEGTKTPFGKLRGQIYRYQGIPVVVTYHPIYLLRTPQDKARAWADLCLALDVIRQAQ
jgi:DNA polymerase